MGKTGRISHYREKLDKTLASPDLTNRDALENLVQKQLLRLPCDGNEGCSENVITKRTTEVAFFLDMLRSASVSEHEVSQHSEWKLKDDNEEYRVMYRPGPQGTPLHTLLVEGYVDGSIDACLCISWESTLYKKWWPQFSFPPFKILNCNCLQKVRLGEQISIVRVKVTWPLSTREAVLHYFLFEYLQDDLIVVLINTISDSEDIDKTTHGFTRDCIPEAKDVVRIDLVGGFAIQKVTAERSYFRTIANMDVKLDFVPPTLINFIARQLIGNGFKLYQKAVTSVSNHDEDFGKALNDPMYTQIRDALYSVARVKETVDKEGFNDTSLPQEHSVEAEHNKSVNMEKNVQKNNSESEYLLVDALNMDKKASDEMKEENTEESRQLENGIMGMEENDHGEIYASDIVERNGLATDRKACAEIEEEGCDSERYQDDGQPLISQIAKSSFVDKKRNISISPQVEQALETLEKAISAVRVYGLNALARPSSVFANSETPNMKKELKEDLIVVKDEGTGSNVEVSTEEAKEERTIERSHESRNSSSNGEIRRVGSNSLVIHNKIAPASPEQYLSLPTKNEHLTSSSHKNGIAEVPITDVSTQDMKQMDIVINDIHENALQGGKKKSSARKRHRFFCLSI